MDSIAFFSSLLLQLLFLLHGKSNPGVKCKCQCSISIPMVFKLLYFPSWPLYSNFVVSYALRMTQNLCEYRLDYGKNCLVEKNLSPFSQYSFQRSFRLFDELNRSYLTYRIYSASAQSQPGACTSHLPLLQSLWELKKCEDSSFMPASRQGIYLIIPLKANLVLTFVVASLRTLLHMSWFKKILKL